MKPLSLSQKPSYCVTASNSQPIESGWTGPKNSHFDEDICIPKREIYKKSMIIKGSRKAAVILRKNPIPFVLQMKELPL